MTDPTPIDRLSRHALVMALWTPVGFVAVALLHMGLTGGGPWWITAGMAMILAAFVGHIIINVTTSSSFTSGETALGALSYSAALVALVLGRLIGPDDMGEGVFLTIGVGLAVILAAVIVYMLIAFGPRGAFARFDVIRDNNLRASSRLTHRGGRR